jgi:predicted small metal-binding protein
MLSVSCRDVGVDCDFKGTGETEEELMNNCVEHAINDHGWTCDDVMNLICSRKSRHIFRNLTSINSIIFLASPAPALLRLIPTSLKLLTV